MDKVSCVYLLHFAKKHEHAAHYLGATDDIVGRLLAHYDGRGANLTKVIRETGNTFSIGRLWICEDVFLAEKILKRMRRAPDLCRRCHRSPRNVRKMTDVTFKLGASIKTEIQSILKERK